MLDLKKISHTSVYQDDWFKQKLGKFSASLMANLISSKSDLGIFSDSAKTYIEGLAGEIVTGTSANKEFFNDHTNYGNATEPEAVEWTAEKLGKFLLRNEGVGDTHRLIIQDEYSGCTPDALMFKNESKLFDSTGTKLNVDTLEVKCPPVLHRFIKLFKCITPLDLKKTEAKYYWQVITQLEFCGSLQAYFAAYNPLFPAKGRIIKFEKGNPEIAADVKKLKATLEHAKIELIKTVELLK